VADETAVPVELQYRTISVIVSPDGVDYDVTIDPAISYQEVMSAIGYLTKWAMDLLDDEDEEEDADAG
jgi:hypothetical protein